jgi:hypothetical protein
VTTGDQATAEQAAFVMEHFRVLEPGRLEVEGRWEGVQGVDLDQSALVLHVEGRVDRVDAESVQRTPHTWRARFDWDGAAKAIDGAFLEVGERLIVEIGARPSARRRLGRPTRPAFPVAAASEDGDIVSLHAALAAAQDRLAEAQDETEVAREAACRAREDADRERTRRESEATRLRDTLDRLTEVADEALRAERARFEEQAAEIERLERGLAPADERVKRLEAELEQAAEDVEEAGRLREVVIGLEVSLDDARRAGAEAAGEVGRLRDRLAAARAALDDG